MNIDQFIDAVRDTLTFWIKIHTDPESWAKQWIVDEDNITATREDPNWHYIQTDYFSFDIMAHALEGKGEELAGEFEQCPECDVISEIDAKICDCDALPDNPDPRDLEQWLVECEAWDLITDEEFYNALLSGFNVYREAMRPHLSAYEMDIETALLYIGGKEGIDLLVATVQATQLWHLNGHVIRDYGHHFGLHYEFVDHVRNEGLAAVFGEEAVNKWLEENA